MLNGRVLLLLLFALPLFGAQAATGRIKKVLPHYLDKQGRHTLAPSLYERDAYQAHLRHSPNERSALRFDVNWKATRGADTNLKLRVELRSSKANPLQPVVLEAQIEPPRFFSRWSALTLKGEDYEKFGDLIAWRATLWEGDLLLAEQKSFLW